MTTNQDRAAEIIAPWIEKEWGHPEDNAESAAEALAEAGLLAPDLPDNDVELAGGSRGWRTPEGGIVWSAPAGRVMIQRVEPGNWTPAEARDVAGRILAAADLAEGEA